MMLILLILLVFPPSYGNKLDGPVWAERIHKSRFIAANFAKKSVSETNVEYGTIRTGDDDKYSRYDERRVAESSSLENGNGERGQRGITAGYRGHDEWRRRRDARAHQGSNLYFGKFANHIRTGTCNEPEKQYVDVGGIYESLNSGKNPVRSYTKL